MKKVLFTIILLLLVVAGGIFYLYSNLEFLVKRQLETAGSEAVGTAVNVDEVVIDLGSGSAGIRGFRVANPEGYSAGNMLSFAELNVVLDLNNLSRERVVITSITGRDPHLLCEMQGSVSNIDVTLDRLAARDAATVASPDTNDEIHLDIARVEIAEIGATLSSTLLAEPLEVSLGNVALRNLSGTPDEIANQIMRPVLAQLSANAARVLLSARAGDLRDEVLDQVDAGLERAGEKVRETGARILDGLGDLLDGEGDDAARPATPQ